VAFRFFFSLFSFFLAFSLRILDNVISMASSGKDHEEKRRRKTSIPVDGANQHERKRPVLHRWETPNSLVRPRFTGRWPGHHQKPHRLLWSLRTMSCITPSRPWRLLYYMAEARLVGFCSYFSYTSIYL
jgi:hypothetical protein